MSSKDSNVVRLERPPQKEAKLPGAGLTEALANAVMSFSGAHRPVADDVSDVQDAHPLDRMVHYSIGTMGSGLSSISLSMAVYDWLAHLSIYPAENLELAQDALKKSLLFSTYLAHAAGNPKGDSNIIIKPQPRDHRFESASWQNWPFNTYYQGFLLAEAWWDRATSGIRGVSRHHMEVANFYMRQLVDVFSPSNLPWTNPEVLDRSVEKGGIPELP